MISPQVSYLIIVSVVTIASIIYRFVKKTDDGFFGTGNIISNLSQLCSVVMCYFFLAGLADSDYGRPFAWIIVILSASLSAVAIGHMIAG